MVRWQGNLISIDKQQQWIKPWYQRNGSVDIRNVTWGYHYDSVKDIMISSRKDIWSNSRSAERQFSTAHEKLPTLSVSTFVSSFDFCFVCFLTTAPTIESGHLTAHEVPGAQNTKNLTVFCTSMDDISWKTWGRRCRRTPGFAR